MNTEFIQLKEVSKSFGKNSVLDSVDLSIQDNQITGIIGASGEGKSTILKLIVGFYRPTKGKVLYLKRNVLNDIKQIKRLFGFATEDGSFYDELSVVENVIHFGRLYRIPSKELQKRTNEIIELVGLKNAARTRAKNLSVGMKKRLDIACSMIHEPQVLILDEPTADLDPLLRSQILALIQKIKKKGTTIIMTTQLLNEMEEICDRIAILHNKKIVIEGKPSEVKSRYDANNLDEVFHSIFSNVEQKRTRKQNTKQKIPEQPEEADVEKKQDSSQQTEIKEESDLDSNNK